MLKLAIDAEDFAMALQSNSFEYAYFLDKKTGEVLFRPDDLSAFPRDDVVHKIAKDQTGRFLLIQPLGSHEAFRIMEKFAGEHVADARVANRLIRALSGKSPFRRFKDALGDHPQVREDWFRYEERALLMEGEAWLANHDIEADWTRHRPE